MTELKKVGFWSDLAKYGWARHAGEMPDGLPDPWHLVNQEWMKDQRTDIIGYLDAGKTAETWRGVSYCRFDCGETNMGCRDLTDGVYLWPEGLSHYVKKHDVALPFNFALHILRQLKQGWAPPRQAPRQIRKP